MQTKEIILTGDRPTGPLHLGHLIGSLNNRVQLQDQHTQFVLIADMQALTDNFATPEKVRDSVYEVLLDYLAVGIDPNKSTICLQSQLPALSELCMYLMNLVSISRLERNPTVKTEIQLKGMGNKVPAGFRNYPISQAADILGFQATLVPVGDDQIPMVELSREIASKFNRIYGETLSLPQTLLSQQSRLPGTDGKRKMSKSLGNAIFLKDDPDTLQGKVMGMYTDPNHIRVSDPGKVEGNPVFTYLDAFGEDHAEIAKMKAHYEQGGLGDVTVKRYLNEVLQAYLRPIREQRAEFSTDATLLRQYLQEGTTRAREVTEAVLQQVKQSMLLEMFD